jgi:hypothetical protein
MWRRLRKQCGLRWNVIEHAVDCGVVDVETHGSMPRPRFAPKVPVGWIVQLYRRDALGLQDLELMEKVGGRLYARCLDVLTASESQVHCVVCQTTFEVAWIGQPSERISRCPRCNWSITAGEYHALFEHQDLLGINAMEAFAQFIQEYAAADGYAQRMLAVDRLVHAVHAGGNTVMRNLVEGRPRQVLATLDALAAGRA